MQKKKNIIHSCISLLHKKREKEKEKENYMSYNNQNTIDQKCNECAVCLFRVRIKVMY